MGSSDHLYLPTTRLIDDQLKSVRAEKVQTIDDVASGAVLWRVLGEWAHEHIAAVVC